MRSLRSVLFQKIFDTTKWGALDDTASKNVQATLVPLTGLTIAGFKINIPGKYLLID